MSKMTERARTYRLPNPTTPEDLECRWSKTLRFGDKVILAGHYYNGAGKPSYYGAVYEFLTEDTGCEAEIGLREVSGVDFMDVGDEERQQLVRSLTAPFLYPKDRFGGLFLCL